MLNLLAVVSRDCPPWLAGVAIMAWAVVGGGLAACVAALVERWKK